MKYIIIFSGYNQRAVVAFLRTLAANRIENYLILAASAQDSILKTEYASHVYAVRKHKPLDFAEITGLIRRAGEELGFVQFVVAPSTEALNRFLLQYEKELTGLGYLTSLVHKELYEQISDKASFCALCARHGILMPQEIAFPEAFAEAFVAKPISYFDAGGNVYSPVLVQSQEDYEAFARDFPQEAFYYQRYVHGRSVYLLYYFPGKEHADAGVLRFSQENLMQQPGGKSILVAKPGSFHTLAVAGQFEELFLEVGYFGLVMVEVRLEGDQAYMIEANPRFWGPSQLFVDAGCNFFEQYLWDYGFLDSPCRNTEICRAAKYFWHGGTRPDLKKEQPVFFAGYEQKYLEEFPELAKWDLYKRADTSRLFLEYE